MPLHEQIQEDTLLVLQYLTYVATKDPFSSTDQTWM